MRCAGWPSGLEGEQQRRTLSQDAADPAVTNKILWVSRVNQEPLHPLRISGTLAGATGVAMAREVPGRAGPSGVNFPRAGCWHVSLAWSGHHDTMDLPVT